jgi:hypothetical protein
VFAGLTLSQEEASRLVAAEVKPPVKRGDLDRLPAGTVVAIIDGQLDQDSAVPIDEICRALRRGVKISGAASVGALRAYEARAAGLAGLGWVYEAYCTGRITGIDEIAVIYDPTSHRPLTIPLVNIRFCLDRLISQRVITAEEAAGAIISLKQLDLAKRDHQSILLRLSSLFGPQRVKEALRLVTPKEVDVKRRDAYKLLRGLANSSELL